MCGAAPVQPADREGEDIWKKRKEIFVYLSVHTDTNCLLIWNKFGIAKSNKPDIYEVSNALLEGVRHFRSVDMDAGFTRNHCACAPMLYISGLSEGCTLANEIDYAWTSIHDNRQGVTASDVVLL